MKLLSIIFFACSSLVPFNAAVADEKAVELDYLNPDWGIRNGWSIDSCVEEGQVAALVRLKTSGSPSWGGIGRMYYNDAEMEVLVSIWGKHEPTIKAVYRVHTNHAKTQDPIKVGTTMIIIGYYFKEQPWLTIKRYIHPTPENMKRVVGLIRQWHGKELAQDPEATARLEKALAANLDAYQNQPLPPPLPIPAPPPAAAVEPPSPQDWLLWLGVPILMVVVTVLGLRWRPFKR